MRRGTFFLLLGSKDQTGMHLDTLSSIARLMSDNVFHFETIDAKDRQSVLDAMQRHINRNVMTTAPQPRVVTEGLRGSLKPFVGMRSDFERRLPNYVADFKDGLRLKSIASTIFMFFACLAPAVTFGGLMGLETGGALAALKMCLYSVFLFMGFLSLRGVQWMDRIGYWLMPDPMGDGLLL